MGAIIGWVILSFLVGLLGNSRKIGFAGAFFLALLLSPLVGIIFTAMSKSNSDIEREAQLLALQKQQADLLKTMQPTPAVPSAVISLPADPEVRANRLKDLRDRGVITQEEFMEQIGRI